jgi:hypothetical protein
LNVNRRFGGTYRLHLQGRIIVVIIIIKRRRTHGRKEGAADQSVHERVGLGTACKGETSRMKSVSIESSGGTTLCPWVEENCVPTEKFLYNKKKKKKKKKRRKQVASRALLSTDYTAPYPRI